MSTNQPAKLTILILLPLLLLFHGSSKISCSTVPDNTTDVLSLLAFKAANDPTGVLNSWNSSTSHCMWKGVKCSVTHPGRVTALEFSGNKLAGSISSSLGNLTFLTTLDLSANGFSGELPPLNRLHKLEILNLSSNMLQGSIPDSIVNCSKLRTLDLSRNSLVGEIPSGVGLLSNLSVLRLSWNSLTGIIPPTISNITSLGFLRMSYNHLIGTIPAGFGQLPHISQVSLGQNNLSGGIPRDLLNGSSLQILSLQNNKLTGALPPDVGHTLPNIETFILAANMIEGQIPSSLGSTSQLSWIDLSQNHFSGEVPSSLGNLSLLKLLSLEVNNLEARNANSWEFIYKLSNCSFLETLSLYDNQLQGVIPNSVGDLPTGLQQLYLGLNNLSGIVPPNIGNLRQLTTLVLNGNSLSGNMEDWIGNMTKLQELQIEDNKFVGPIPSAIFSLSQLQSLYLANNEFEGPIPSILGNLQLLWELDLSYNNLDGNVPPEVINLKQLVKLRLSSNNLSGEIPDILGQCQSLVKIEMDQNTLIGNIPKSFGNLQHLLILNLSHNSLSGSIPTSLDVVLSLIMLDLSYNHLQGEVPQSGVFKNTTMVTLNGNWGLCGGVTDLHMPACPAVPPKRTERKHYLIILLITVFGFMSLVMSVYAVILGDKASKRTQLLFLSFGKKFPRVSYKDLAQATANFSELNLIGRGSYGSVYRGKLTQAKIQVAIKVFDLGMRFADKSFVLECEVLRSIRHRNLVPILTACSTIDNRGNDFKALVYEFMHNGNLDTWLHQKHGGTDPKLLGLARKISIAVDLADALAYLHHDCGRPIVHCDLKPTNILLDDDMNAYLGDFGIASLVIDSRSTTVGQFGHNSSVAVTGTIGYIAPGTNQGYAHALLYLYKTCHHAHDV